MRIFEQIFLQTRQKYAGGLSPGKYFSRSMQQNLPKRHVYTLVKTGSKKADSICVKKQMSSAKQRFWNLRGEHHSRS